MKSFIQENCSGCMTYGPSSEGVTGSPGGGGRLMKVGADMNKSEVDNFL